MPELTNNPAKSESIINKVTEIFYNTKRQLENAFLDHKTIIDRAHTELQPLVYDYYDISVYEQVLVDDTVNISCKSVMPTYKTHPPTLSSPSSDQRTSYANLLCDTLNQWAHRGRLRVKAFCRVSSKLGLGILTLHKCNDLMPYEETSATEELQESLRRIKRSLREDCGHFSYMRGLKIFEQNELHLIKPLTLRHWTRTAALNDADEIATAILSARRDA